MQFQNQPPYTEETSSRTYNTSNILLESNSKSSVKRSKIKSGAKLKSNSKKLLRIRKSNFKLDIKIMSFKSDGEIRYDETRESTFKPDIKAKQDVMQYQETNKITNQKTKLSFSYLGQQVLVIKH
ncbi:hypothetical protein LOAG_09554 [Loa loa]|uniref:Uncharacterized protein n=1 Tax=Loa loa TaxID=7209 RepID=A0A1S0TS82_LOALO|nr:hypothetical protein LOAG_09554 [Loa loa]EFO18942.1 hypothetical protein LOAG_09554 [Loa loa]